jgi:uncharacterized protein (DUF433 family)
MPADGRRRALAARDELRFNEPLYTVAEAAWFLGVPTSTFSAWAKGYERRFVARPVVKGAAVVTAVEAQRNFPSVPFVGLAEGMVIAAFRTAGVSLQHIRKAVSVLEREIGIEHALASKRLFTDGAVILYDYAEREDDEQLTEVVSQQRVFSEVVDEYLRRIAYGHDGWAAKLISPATPRAVIEVDPERSFGQPIFIHGAVRVEDVIDRWRAGDPLAEVAGDFGVPLEDVEDVLRVAVPIAA